MRQRLLTPYILACLSATASSACDTHGRGPLEIFHGPDVAVGAGIARTELRFDGADRLVSASVVLDDAALASLPATGSTIEHILPLAADAPRTVFDHVGLDWNPEGQPAPRVYGQPHLGVHFYLIPEQQRNAMTLADPAFAARAAKAPSAEEMPPDHHPDAAGVPRMGTHWVDGRSRTWQGMRFGSTVAYGFYDGKMVFIEPLVTRAYLRSIAADGIRLRVPARYQRPGGYPSRVRVAYDHGTHLYRIALTDFVEHDSGKLAERQLF